MTREEILALSDEEVLTLAYQLRIPYQLKLTPRYAAKRNKHLHSESVAEHQWALDYLSEFFLPLEDPDGKLNQLRVRQLLRFHDFGEISDEGDIPYHWKTAVHEERERAAAEQLFRSLPEPIRTVGWYAWCEYEARETPTAKFAYALDKLEPIFELLDPVNEQSLKRLKFTYEHHINVKRRATATFPVMRRFVDVISADMVKRDVFWKEPVAVK